MKLCGVIFDADGTLLDSMSVWDNISDEYLLSLGITPEDNLSEKVSAMSQAEAAEYFISRYKLNKTVDEITDGINSMLCDKYRFEIGAKEGVKDFLTALFCGEVKMCIATATDKKLVSAALERCGIDMYFGEIFTCGKIGKSKSHPDIYLSALEYLKTDKENTVVFEDAYHAVKTAKQSGFKVACMFDKSEKNADKARNLSDFYFNNFAEAQALLKFRNGEMYL